jgi:hypothetical protein
MCHLSTTKIGQRLEQLCSPKKITAVQIETSVKTLTNKTPQQNDTASWKYDKTRDKYLFFKPLLAFENTRQQSYLHISTNRIVINQSNRQFLVSSIISQKSSSSLGVGWVLHRVNGVDTLL